MSGSHHSPTVTSRQREWMSPAAANTRTTPPGPSSSHGLAALLCSHAKVSGSTVSLNFPASSGREWESDITDADLAAVIRSLKRHGSKSRLLAWRDGSRWHPISSTDINANVRQQTGGEFTAKGFRTLHGTIAAAVSLAKRGPEMAQPKRTKALAQAMRDTAEVLGNTPAIAKSSYIDPRVVDN